MQDGLSTKPSRREMLTGAAVAAVAFGASTIVPADEMRPAAQHLPRWQEAARAHLEAEREFGTASEAVEQEQERLPMLRPMPEAPDPADYVSEETRQAGDVRAIDAEAERNPGFHHAREDYEKALADWHEADRQHRSRERRIADYHGLEEARRADCEARRKMEKAGHELLRAPIETQVDALAAVTVILYTADFNYGIFEDERKCLGVDPGDLLRRLEPWLPASPAATPLY